VGTTARPSTVNEPSPCAVRVQHTASRPYAVVRWCTATKPVQCRPASHVNVRRSATPANARSFDTPAEYKKKKKKVGKVGRRAVGV